MDHLFLEIASVIVTAGVVALVARFLRQPLIIAYIFTGLLVGPSLLGFTSTPEVFEAFSEIGIALLLFMVGLELNWKNVKDVGLIAVLAGMGQVIFTSVIGYLVALSFGFETTTALFLGLAFAFSSTIIIVKMLSDKEDIDRFYGRISIGILIVQDLAAMLILLALSAFRDSTGGAIEVVLATAVVKMILVILVLFLVAHFILPHVFKYAAKSQELLFLVAMAWCFAIAAALHLLGFGIEIGALIAGVSLAGLDFSRDIETRIRPLRDFFLILFFIFLGTTLGVDALGSALVPGLVFSAFILIGNPLILMIILRIFGYHPRTGFLVGVTMAQISEFSFILIAGAAVAGFVDDSILPLTTVVALITIAVSTYLIKYNEQIYEKIEFLFRPFEVNHEKGRKRLAKAPEIVMLGYHRIGETILPTLKKLGKEYMVIDFDPAAITELEAKKIPHMYGDAGSSDTLSFIRAHNAKIVISTIPDDSVSRDILEYIKKKKRSRAMVIVTVKTPKSAAKMYELGAHFVIVPNILGGEHFAELLKKKKDKKSSWNAVAKKQKKAFGFK